MKLRLPVKSLLAAALGLAFLAGANAQLVPNTGVDTTPHNGFDDNYLYLGMTGAVGTKGTVVGQHAVIAAQPGFPMSTGNWPANNATSSWIMPTTGLVSDGLAIFNTPGIYSFETTFNFDTTKFSLALSSVSFKVIADNMMSVYLNGAPLFSSALDNDVFGFDTTFTLTALTGLVGGTNTLDFYVTNIPGDPTMNPTGFRLEDTSVLGLVSAVPEASTYGMVASAALVGLVGVRRIRRKSVARA
jgi:hypothetical protein